MIDKILLSLIAGLIVSTGSLLFVRDVSRNDPLSTSSSANYMGPVLVLESTSNKRNHSENGRIFIGNLCPAVMPNIDRSVRGLPAPSIAHDSGSGGGCDGRVSTHSLLLTGTLINVALYSLGCYCVLALLEKRYRKSPKNHRPKTVV